MVKKRCPDCGARLIEYILASKPVQFEYECSKVCGYGLRYYQRRNPFERIKMNEKADKLRQIGFYTLRDERAENCTHQSPLWRCELLVTSRCNFNCPYCRKRDLPDLSKLDATLILNLWFGHHLQNVRFSGGEPTLWPHLEDMVALCKANHVKRIAVSTNGSADFELYQSLVEAGVNDFSISLDACCSSTGKTMSGTSNDDIWKKVISNIKGLSKMTYVTVGVVLTGDNISEVEGIIEFAHGLGVADIRIIPAAQVSKFLPALNVDKNILNLHPILKYRISNARSGKLIRGMREIDDPRCSLVLDDMAVENGEHYPCIIYLREGGSPIGKLGHHMREERLKWFMKHDCKKDPICKNNCLDVCVDYNNRVLELCDG